MVGAVLSFVYYKVGGGLLDLERNPLNPFEKLDKEPYEPKYHEDPFVKEFNELSPEEKEKWLKEAWENEKRAIKVVSVFYGVIFAVWVICKIFKG